MPKIEAGPTSASFKLNGKTKRTSLYELEYTEGTDYVGLIRVYGNRDDIYVIHPISVTEWTDASDNNFADIPSFEAYVETFFFNLTGGGSGQDPILPDLRLIFFENFTGDGITTTFNLTGGIQNGTFSEGSWDASNVLLSLPSHVVREDNNKPTYDTVPNFLGNRISVSLISATGQVTFSHPPRNGVQVSVFYWYDTQTGDVVEDYFRPDFVSSMEADNSRIDAKIDDHVNNTSNPHSVTANQVGLGNVNNTSDLNKPISTAQQLALDNKYDLSNPNGYETPTELNTRDSNNRSRANHTGTQLHTTISDFDSGVRTNRLDQMSQPTASLLLNNQQIKVLSDPTDPQDAVNKRYCDNQYEFLTSLDILNNSPLPGQTTEGLINNTTVFETFINQQFIPNKTGNFICDSIFFCSSNDAAQDVLVNFQLFQGLTLVSGITEPMRLEQKDPAGTGVVLNTISGGAITGSANCGTNQRNPKKLDFNVDLTQGVTYNLLLTFAGSANGDLIAIHSGKTSIEEKLIL